MPKFVNVTAGRRDGVELLLSTLQGLRQEEIAAGDQMVRLKAIESQLEGERLNHVRDMTMLAQQRQQFSLDHKYRLDKLEHDGKILDLERDRLGEAALTRQANLLQTYATMNTRLSEFMDNEYARMGAIKQKQLDLVTSLEQSGSVTQQYIYGPRLNAQGQPDGTGVVVLRDPRLKQLYDSMAKDAKGRFMDEGEFGAQWMESFNTGMEDSLDQGEESAFRYATEFATVNTIAKGINKLAGAGKVHPDLQRAADAWALGDQAAYRFIRDSVGFDNGGIVFNAKLDNKKLTGNGAMLIANNQRLNAPVREYGRTYRETRGMQKTMDKMFDHSQLRTAEMEVQTELLGHQLTKGFVDLFGDAYAKDNPFFSPGAGGGEGDTYGPPAPDTGPTTSTPTTTPDAPSSNDQAGGGFRPTGQSFAPVSPPESVLDTRPPGLEPELFATAQNVGFTLGLDENGEPTMTIKEHYDMRSGEPQKVAPITRRLSINDFSAPHSARSLDPGEKGISIQNYDTEAYERVKRAADKADRIRKRQEQERILQSDEFQKLWAQGPWAAMDTGPGNEEPRPTWYDQAGNSGDNQFANTGIQAGEGFYDSMHTELYRQAQSMGVPNPQVLAELGAAQSTLETGHGESVVGNNYFGIKAPAGADSTTAQTTEYVDGKRVVTSADFRSYGSPTESAAGWLNFIIQNPRYADVLKARNVEEAIQAVSKAGYATDPTYADKLMKIHGSKRRPSNIYEDDPY